MTAIRNVDRLLASTQTPDQIAYRIGIISDTHIPYRLLEIPPALLDALQGVDLILHAGDVGKLWVLDHLSQVAPVVAVHGNDDSPESGEILPYTQIIGIGGRRILLWHSHYPDWQEEFASRQDNAFLPKLERITGQGKAVGAEIVVFGHWHIPLVYKSQGVTAINPGALASGNEITRQLRQTGAVLFLEHSGQHQVIHFDLAKPEQPFDPQIDFPAGFLTAAEQFSSTILADELVGRVMLLRAALTRAEILRLRDSIVPLAHRCWQGEFDVINHRQLTAVIEDDPQLPESLRQRALEILGASRP